MWMSVVNLRGWICVQLTDNQGSVLVQSMDPSSLNCTADCSCDVPHVKVVSDEVSSLTVGKLELKLQRTTGYRQ